MEIQTFLKQHLNLEDLIRKAKNGNLSKKYLEKWIPNYPKFPEFPLEFHGTRLKHDTTPDGLKGIWKDEGFRVSVKDSLMWWSLAVGPEEINDAEERLQGGTGPNQTRYLWKFATSPAFKETSRLGSFRFTFPLEEVLTAYKKQLCSGAEPVMRVYKTDVYQQEVMYVVLVHSPDFNKKFESFPLLEDNPEAICVYRDGRFIWRAQAMCETHWYDLSTMKDPDQMEVQGNPQFYVWDHFVVALHVENKEVFKFGVDKLGKNLKYCEKDDVTYKTQPFIDLDEARELVSGLWPNRPGPLEVEPSLQLSYPVKRFKLVLAGSSEEEIMSTENAILGRGAFTPEVQVDNLVVKIINTPPFSRLQDASRDAGHLRNIRLSGPELEAFLLVIKLQDINVQQILSDIENLKTKFGNRVLRHTMIAITHQGRIEPDIQNLLEQLQNFLGDRVGNRLLVFNNNLNDRDPAQVSHLLRRVRNMIEGRD